MGIPILNRWWCMGLFLCLNPHNAYGQDPLPLGLADWGMEVNVASTMKAPFVGRVHILTRSLLKVSMEEVDGTVRAHQKLCHIAVEDDMRVSETKIPQQFVDAIPPETYSITYDEVSGAYHADLGPYAVGFDPEINGGLLPTKKARLGVVDTDQDGHPGATVHVQIGLLGLFVI